MQVLHNLFLSPAFRPLSNQICQKMESKVRCHATVMEEGKSQWGKNKKKTLK